MHHRQILLLRLLVGGASELGYLARAEELRGAPREASRLHLRDEDAEVEQRHLLCTGVATCCTCVAA